MSSRVKTVNDNFLFSKMLLITRTLFSSRGRDWGEIWQKSSRFKSLTSRRNVLYDSPGTPTDTSIRTARTLTSRPVSTNSFFFFLFVTLSQCLFGKLGHNRTCTHCTLSLSQYYYCRQHETNNESSEWSRYIANVRDCHQGVFESWPKNSTDDHMSNLVFAVVLGRREDVPARYPEYSRISNSNVPEIIVFTHRWIQSMAREKDVRWVGARFRSWKIRTRWEISGSKNAERKHVTLLGFASPWGKREQE